jgi:hypothetical protein
MRGLAFIASDTLASVSCLDSGNLVHVSSTWTGDIPPELSHKGFNISTKLRLKPVAGETLV